MVGLGSAKSLLRRIRFSLRGELDRIGLFELGSVGQRVRLSGWVSFGSEPFLVHLGSDITITEGVVFVTHDGGARVFRGQNPDLHVYGKISVNDNVFIGMRTIILPGVNIGSNVVIGAGSVVTKDVPDGTVNAGVPCRTIGTIEQYHQKVCDKGFDWPVGNYGDEWKSAVIRKADR